jgi:predicted acylesterase/phospholipase RssA
MHPSAGPTAFVLAGGGTKGSFEVGVLQYLVGVEGITPDIIAATSAGAIAATVLSQARTPGEFAERVDEIERDVLAWTTADYVFGKQPWLRALEGTALGREIDREVTQGTRPPFPVTPTSVLAAADSAPSGPADVRAQRRQARRAGRRRKRRFIRLAGGAALRLPRVRRHLRAGGSSVLNLEPLAHGLRHGTPDGVKAVDRSLLERPGLQLRLAVTALRAGVLRFVTEDGTIVESDARTPAPGEAAGPVDVVDGAIASASVPMIFPPHAMAGDDYVDGGVVDMVPVRAAVALGATRIIAVVAVPLRLPREERDFSAAPAISIGLRSMGMIGVAERQLANLSAPLPPGATLTTVDPVVDVVGLFEVEPGLLRINRDYGWLRASDVLSDGDRTLVADLEASTHTLIDARREAWRLEELLWADAEGDEPDAGTMALVRERKVVVRRLLERRKQLGYPVPDGHESWWTDYETHAALPPEGLPETPGTPRD